MPLQKPDKYLRFSPLVKVIPATRKLQSVMLFSPDPIRHERERKYCFCRTNASKEMILCDECHEWYHFKCVGMDEEAAAGDDAWQCGYCMDEADEDGNRSWKLDIPPGKRKKKRTAPERNDDETPKALGFEPEKRAKVKMGPKDWDAIKLITAEGGKKINMEEERKKKKAEKLVKELGHHIVDEMTSAGLAMRNVDGPLIDDLEELGFLDDA